MFIARSIYLCFQNALHDVRTAYAIDLAAYTKKWLVEPSQYSIVVDDSPAPIVEAPPRLPRLPGEILNLIYEFALTHDKPLFCLFPKRIGEKAAFYTKSIEPCGCCEFRFQCTCTECYFQYEFNMLKYVCRKFYEETAGLELRYNNLTFGKAFDFNYTAISAAATFSMFYYCTISLPWQASLRKVYIRHHRPVTSSIYKGRRYTLVSLESDAPRRDELSRLCIENPHLTVFHEIHGLGMWLGPDFINTGLTVQAAGRGDVAKGIFNPFPTCQGSTWLDNVETLRHAFFSDQDAPPNLRFLPQGKWHEEAWVAGIKRLRKRLRFSRLPALEEKYVECDGLSTWTREIGRWYEEGI